MRTRPREVMRLLATLRHSARCRALRASTAQEAMRLARQEAEEAQEADEGADRDDEQTRGADSGPPAHRRVH
ncbi:hypothetical protein [Caballeronia sp. Lep1P3]|uniref:hypothetical protein n=1 Tax=Caballeronia sp. Lep1P3 TaxID=2878150 RepID=UPI001FCFEF90|nr:hypothetical protein [Caballeronia sp. Lep1P3]